MGSAADWHTFLDEFRTFGGKAENVMQRKGLFGQGLFPIDSSKPIELCVPDQLLVEIDNVELSGGDIVIKDASDFPEGYADWFRRYQSNYSWGLEGRENTLVIEEGLKSLPDEVKKILIRCGLYRPEVRFPEKDKEQELMQRFIQTRCINRKGKRVIMPMIELLNHAPSAKPYNMEGDNISVEGIFEGEVLARYSVTDPIRRFFGYGFNANEMFGFSLSFLLKHRDKEIVIRGGAPQGNPGRPIEIKFKDEKIILSQPMLGSMNSPKMPRTVFIKSLQNIDGIDPNELFDLLHHRNTQVYVQLLRLLHSVEGDVANTLRTACLDQLIALSHHIGQRDDLLDQNSSAAEAA